MLPFNDEWVLFLQRAHCVVADESLPLDVRRFALLTLGGMSATLTEFDQHETRQDSKNAIALYLANNPEPAIV